MAVMVFHFSSPENAQPRGNTKKRRSLGCAERKICTTLGCPRGIVASVQKKAQVLKRRFGVGSRYAADQSDANNHIGRKVYFI
jgi:hypothetical protein